MLDLDQDGVISYHDFTAAVGGEIHPGETLYFRQDKASLGKMTNKIPPLVGFEKCEKLNCWEGKSPRRRYCQNHMSALEDDCSKVLWKIS